MIEATIDYGTSEQISERFDTVVEALAWVSKQLEHIEFAYAVIEPVAEEDQ